MVPTRVERWGIGCQDSEVSSTVPHIVDLACGWKHTVAVDSNGVAWSFGELGFGRLGLGDVMASVLISLNGPATEGSSKFGFGFGMTATGDLCATIPHPIMMTMGDQGEQADEFDEPCGMTLKPELEPQAQVAREIVKVRSCAAGDFHSAFLSRTGELFTCGRGEYGRLGHGDHEDVWQPKVVRALAPTSQQGHRCRLWLVACGEAHTVVAAADGRVFTCGSNRAGALGHGDTLDRLVPEPIPGLTLRAMRGPVNE